jgi:hypothetical protein
MQQRADNEIATQVALEIRTEKASASAERNRLGDAVGEDGNMVFVQAQPELDMNHGNNSNVEREAYKSRLDRMIPEDVQQPTKSDKSGKCGIAGKCTNPNLPLHVRCNSQGCDTFVQRSCAMKRKLVVMNGSENIQEHKVYCSKVCKPRRQNSVDRARNAICCSIADCRYPNIALNPEHKCGACGKLAHRLCAEEKELIDSSNEDVEYCSVACKDR